MTLSHSLKLKMQSHRQDLLWISLIITVLIVVYSITLLPGVGNNCDTAKFQFVGRVLGTPHPIGFPTYIFFNHLFTRFFPFGSLAYRANLLSAIFAILTCLVLYRTIEKIFSVRRFIAFIASLTFGVTFCFWSQAIVAEVNTLHMLFVALTIYFFLRWNQNGQDKYFLIASAIYAISFGNHPTVIFFLPGVVFITWATDKKVFINPKKVLLVLLFIVIGALQYGYFFWRYYSPDTLYLEMATPDLKTFLWYATGAQFKSQMFSYSLWEILSQRVPWFFKQVLNEYLFLTPIALWGIFKWRDKTIHTFLALLFLGNMIPTINYSAKEILSYFMPNYLILAIYIGIGLESLHVLSEKRRLKFLSYAVILIPVFFILTNHAKMRPFNDPFHAKKVETVLQLVKKDALIISPDDYYSQYFWYYLIGEKVEALRGVYLMHHFDFNRVKEYIQNDKPFYLPEQRKYVPVGLKVYVMKQSQIKLFEQGGFQVRKIRPFLYRVHL